MSFSYCVLTYEDGKVQGHWVKAPEKKNIETSYERWLLDAKPTNRLLKINADKYTNRNEPYNVMVDLSKVQSIVFKSSMG